MSNSIDPDETAHYEPSHLDLRCLPKPIVITYGSERAPVIYLREYADRTVISLPAFGKKTFFFFFFFLAMGTIDYPICLLL